VKAAQGLTLSEAENAFAKAIAEDGILRRDDVALVLEEKRQVIRKSGLLEYFVADQKLADVGGLELLKGWLDRRAAAFGEAARSFGLPEPKGLLLLGVQGCGKSLTAKAVAAQWGLPLLRLDMGRIFSGLIGSSEENLRKAISVAESVAPVVLWIDEIEKGLSGVRSSDSSDSGVTARVFGTLLTWLQEKTAPAFVVATANRIDALPPELLRKGRFDEIFFVDLPELPERREIFQIHIRRRKRDPAAFDLDALARDAEGFSGAEIEQAVVSGLYDAFAEKTELTQRHLVRAIGETKPLSTTMAEEIDRVRDWARTRTRPASARQSRG
jgi:SpoVK/Ycf46/Vps4 family AAA+-type ATPase